MCPGMAAEALRLGDASAEKVEQDLASPMGLLDWQGWIWVLCVMPNLNFRNDSTGPKDGGATGLLRARFARPVVLY